MMQGIFNIFLIVLEKLLTLFLIIIPGEIALFLGGRLGDLIFFLARFTRLNKRMSDRKYMINNVALTFGNRFSEKERYLIVKSGLQKMGKSLVEVFRFPLLNKTNLHKKVKFVGREYLDKSFAQNKGVILVSAHFGNWELLGASLSLEGYTLAIVTQPQSNPVIDSFLNRRRESKGTKVVLRWYTNLRVLIKLLKENYALGMLVDQHSESEKVFGTFFGHRVSLHEGPASLSIFAGSPIVPVFIIRNSDDTHCVIIEPPLNIESLKEKDKDKEIEIISQMISSVLERYISLYPDHWDWMYNRWDKLK